MKQPRVRRVPWSAVVLCLWGLWWSALAFSQETTPALQVAGLQNPVEILTDQWGIPHIYAKNQHDLFFAQGYNAARDRLFQFEIWRRRVTGTMAEIQGPKALDRDIGARLLRFRGDLAKELNFYHSAGEQIVNSFVAGINAYIAFTEHHPESLPIEFRLLGLKPQPWTADIVISRIGGLFTNVEGEVRMAQRVLVVGAELTKQLIDFTPHNPDLTPPGGLALAEIPTEVLRYYTAARAGVSFAPADVVDPAYRADANAARMTSLLTLPDWLSTPTAGEGSNNWVVNGTRTLSHQPMMVNDPHRAITAPSLRYWAHLNAPEWNVIGGGEPHLPGISIGHNQYGAWGLTIFPTDSEDLYVYDTNPANPNQYRYRGTWKDMTIFRETFAVKGNAPTTVELKYTEHGPILLEDRARHRAFALRAAWLDIGAAPYLASLRMDQAKTWEEFRAACAYSRAPSENMVWADTAGHIGWQATGAAPIRANWNGLLPVPGDGRFEWSGLLPTKAFPSVYDPPQGFFATANAENLPPGYPHTIGYIWEPPYRLERIQEVLKASQGLTTADMMRLQNDETSILARTLISLLKGLHSSQPAAQTALTHLQAWNAVLNRDSLEAGIYAVWQQKLWENFRNRRVPEAARPLFARIASERLLASLTTPDNSFGEDPVAGRNQLLVESLEQAVQELTTRFGPDMNAWKYGQEKFHHIVLRHMLSSAVKDQQRAQLDIGPLPRGGDGFTVNNTDNAAAQLVGASFRIIADLADWDRSLGVNTPGQSGDPANPQYRDLTALWADGKYFPVMYSREKVEGVTKKREMLQP